MVDLRCSHTVFVMESASRPLPLGMFRVSARDYNNYNGGVHVPWHLPCWGDSFAHFSKAVQGLVRQIIRVV